MKKKSNIKNTGYYTTLILDINFDNTSLDIFMRCRGNLKLLMSKF